MSTDRFARSLSFPCASPLYKVERMIEMKYKVTTTIMVATYLSGLAVIAGTTDGSGSKQMDSRIGKKQHQASDKEQNMLAKKHTKLNEKKGDTELHSSPGEQNLCAGKLNPGIGQTSGLQQDRSDGKNPGIDTEPGVEPKSIGQITGDPMVPDDQGKVRYRSYRWASPDGAASLFSESWSGPNGESGSSMRQYSQYETGSNPNSSLNPGNIQMRNGQFMFHRGRYFNYESIKKQGR